MTACTELIADLRKALCSEESAKPAAVNRALNAFKFDPDAWRRFIHFSSAKYTRNLVVYEKQFSVLLLCWACGQKTPVHDHGNVGMQTWVKVVKGVLTLQRHESNDRTSSIIQETVLSENSVLFFDDSIGSHRIRNKQESEVAVSLHIYSPPMLGCSGVPTVFCQEVANSLTAAERIVIHTRYPHNILYTNFKSLIDALHMELSTPMSVEELSGEIGAVRRRHVQQLLSTMRFNPNEWMQYARFKDGRYTKNLVGHGENFTVVLMCWEKKQMGPIHDHCGSDGWIKVLDGQLHEFVYDVTTDTAVPTMNDADDLQHNALRHTSENIINTEEVSCISGNGVHNLGNPSSDDIVVSLHVYSPPHSICNFYDARTGVKTVSTLMAVNGLAPPEAGASAVDSGGNDRCAKRRRLSVEPPLEQVNLAKFLTELKVQLSEDQDGQRVMQLLKRLTLHESEWRQCVRFDSDSYARTLVALEPSFTVVLICWDGGQGSPIHDHGKDTRSWAKVLEGTLTMKRYERRGTARSGGGGLGRSRSSKQPAVMDEKQFQQGECLMETEYTGLHKLGNTSETARAVSLHVYSPPCAPPSQQTLDRSLYKACTQLPHVPAPYMHLSLLSFVCADIHCCYETSGGGTEVIPAVHTATGAARELRSKAAGADSGGASEDATRRLRRPAAPEAPADVSLTLSSSSAQLKLEMQAFGVIYTDFQSCASFLKTELNPNDVKATSAIMQGFDFHPEEWQQYSNYQAVFAGNPHSAGRNQALIVHDDRFAMVLTRWDANHTGPPIHNCGSKCWIKVLDGRLEETHYTAEVESEQRVRDRVEHSAGSDHHPDSAHALASTVSGTSNDSGNGTSGDGDTGQNSASDGKNYTLDLTRTATLTAGSVTFISGLAVHSVENTADHESFSLHLYSPPCRGLFCYAHTRDSENCR